MHEATPMLYFEFAQRVSVCDDEPSRYVSNISGTIGMHPEDDDDETEIGRFRIFIVNAEQAVNDEASLFDVFDRDEALGDYFSLYEDEDGAYTSAVLAALKIEPRWAPNMLILDRLEIEPAHRGMGYGLQVLRSLMERFAIGCGLIAMKPFPLQFENRSPAENSMRAGFKKMRLDLFSDDRRRADKKLRDYYAKLGFKRVRGTPLMVFDTEGRIPG